VNADTMSLIAMSTVAVFLLIWLGYAFAALAVAAGVFLYIWRP